MNKTIESITNYLQRKLSSSYKIFTVIEPNINSQLILESLSELKISFQCLIFRTLSTASDKLIFAIRLAKSECSNYFIIPLDDLSLVLTQKFEALFRDSWNQNEKMLSSLLVEYLSSVTSAYYILPYTKSQIVFSRIPFSPASNILYPLIRFTQTEINSFSQDPNYKEESIIINGKTVRYELLDRLFFFGHHEEELNNLPFSQEIIQYFKCRANSIEKLIEYDY